VTQRIFIVFFILISGLAQPGVAQISPGKLSTAHANLEGMANCTQCHQLGQKQSDEKCLACHMEIKQLVDAGRGYHATVHQQGKTCATCHPEHHGREFNLIYWQPPQTEFDHQLTGYPLKGAHQKLECRQCHQAKNIAHNPSQRSDKTQTFLGLQTDCLSCHADQHRGQLGTDCRRCHSNETWQKPPLFDHRQAQFQLEGAHQQVDCAKCHRTQQDDLGEFTQYKPLQFENCTACHTDPHQGAFGQDCRHCHNNQNWQNVRLAEDFDHAKTGFPLKGKHQTVDCAKCHTSGRYTTPLKADQCRDCHVDYHQGQFQDRPDQGMCESCHAATGFLPAQFALTDHQQSRYPLSGAHLAVPCNECHVKTTIRSRQTPKFDFSDLSCQGCHTDPHEGQFRAKMGSAGCETCHSRNDWHDVRYAFDHNQTRFPLVGKHAEQACEKCHQPDNRQVVRYTPLETGCAGCHGDIHQGQFAGDSCEQCHTPMQNWSPVKFAHNRASRFKLDGAHAEVPCEQCHPQEVAENGDTFRRFKPLGMECKDCHTAY